jgi:hypothetical protein
MRLAFTLMQRGHFCTDMVIAVAIIANVSAVAFSLYGRHTIQSSKSEVARSVGSEKYGIQNTCIDNKALLQIASTLKIDEYQLYDAFFNHVNKSSQ